MKGQLSYSSEAFRLSLRQWEVNTTSMTNRSLGETFRQIDLKAGLSIQTLTEASGQASLTEFQPDMIVDQFH